MKHGIHSVIKLCNPMREFGFCEQHRPPVSQFFDKVGVLQLRFFDCSVHSANIKSTLTYVDRS